MLVGGGIAWGTTTAQQAAITEAVEQLRQHARSTTSTRAVLASDVRVIQTRQEAITESLRSVVAAVDRLEAVTARLEALASWAARPQ